MSDYQKPIPAVNPESKPFWEACKRHELYVQKCGDCGILRYYPRELCGACLSSNVEWVKCSGKGEVYTFTVTHQHRGAGFREDLPFVMAYIKLEEGVRMLSNIIQCDPATVHVGMPVEVVFEDVNDEISLPKFKPQA